MSGKSQQCARVDHSSQFLREHDARLNSCAVGRGVTMEKKNSNVHSRKFRVLLIRKEFLNGLGSERDVHFAVVQGNKLMGLQDMTTEATQTGAHTGRLTVQSEQYKIDRLQKLHTMKKLYNAEGGKYFRSNLFLIGDIKIPLHLPSAYDAATGQHSTEPGPTGKRKMSLSFTPS
eukprot:COSAG01_NODE_26041_length_725_cov_1.020767_1_plen_173_part_10